MRRPLQVLDHLAVQVEHHAKFHHTRYRSLPGCCRFTGEDEAFKFLDDLADQVEQRLKAAGVRGRTITLKVKRRKEVRWAGEGQGRVLSRVWELQAGSDMRALWHVHGSGVFGFSRSAVARHVQVLFTAPGLRVNAGCWRAHQVLWRSSELPALFHGILPMARSSLGMLVAGRGRAPSKFLGAPANPLPYCILHY
jgi:hypothetical protein